MTSPASGHVYDVVMRRPRQAAKRPPGPYWGHATLDAWAGDIAARRAAYPTRDEMQAVITAMLRAGAEVQEVAAALGMTRQAVHRFDTSAGPRHQAWRARTDDEETTP